MSLTRDAREIYKNANSGDGTSTAVQDLKISISDFATTADGIIDKCDKGPKPVTEAEVKLSGAAKACGNTARQLYKIADDLVLDKKGKLLKAYKIAWRQNIKIEEIGRLQRRLDVQWSLLQNRLTLTMRDQQPSTSDMWARFDQLDARLETRTTNILHQHRQYVLAIIIAVQKNSPQRPNQTKQALDVLAEDVRRLQRQQAVLESLQFQSMQYRHEQIKQAHSGTFESMFERTQLPLIISLNGSAGATICIGSVARRAAANRH